MLTYKEFQSKQKHKTMRGSKLIQHNILSEDFYLRSAVFCLFKSYSSYRLVFCHKKLLSLTAFALIILSGWFYFRSPF